MKTPEQVMRSAPEGIIRHDGIANLLRDRISLDARAEIMEGVYYGLICPPADVIVSNEVHEQLHR